VFFLFILVFLCIYRRHEQNNSTTVGLGILSIYKVNSQDRDQGLKYRICCSLPSHVETCNAQLFATCLPYQMQSQRKYMHF